MIVARKIKKAEMMMPSLNEKLNRNVTCANKYEDFGESWLVMHYTTKHKLTSSFFQQTLCTIRAFNPLIFAPVKSPLEQ